MQVALEAARGVRLVAAVAPRNAVEEHEALATALDRGEPRLPRWDYVGHDVAPVVEALRVARDAPMTEPLGALFRARIDELLLEAALVAAVEKPELAALSAERFGDGTQGDALANAWVTEDSADPGQRYATDGFDVRSLASRVRTEIGIERAPFAVKIVAGLSSYAATGERTVYVARGAWLTERAAHRIAIHEVRGHVLPRVRAASLHPIFALGTARGADDQEGLALVHEERAGMLDASRRVELARRHLTVRAMRGGADFVEVVRALAGDGVSSRDAVRIASRAFRGGNGQSPGLGRESVYITSFVRVRSAPEAEAIIASGQVSLESVDALRQLGGKHASPEPPPMTDTV